MRPSIRTSHPRASSRSDTCQPVPSACPLGAAFAAVMVQVPTVHLSGRAFSSPSWGYLGREQSPLQQELSFGGSWHFGEKT